MSVRFTKCLFILGLLCSPVVTRAQSAAPITGEISAPGFMWNEASERIEGRIEATKGVSVERRKIGQRWALLVSGFKPENPPRPPAITRMIFYFDAGKLANAKGRDGKPHEKVVEGQLVEVEYQFQQPGWTEDRYGTCVSEKRQLLERMYGQGQPLIRKTSPTPDGEAAQTIVGYKWNKNNTAVELIYYHLVAKTAQQEFHTLSLHYKRS